MDLPGRRSNPDLATESRYKHTNMWSRKMGFTNEEKVDHSHVHLQTVSFSKDKRDG